jgi:hypothetical protein
VQCSGELLHLELLLVCFADQHCNWLGVVAACLLYDVTSGSEQKCDQLQRLLLSCCAAELQSID